MHPRSWLLFFLISAITPSTLLALPRYAIQEGVSCSSCHVNPTGAGKRNDQGGFFFTQDLSLAKNKNLSPKEVQGRLSPFAAIGADLRMHDTTTFGNPKTNNFNIPQGSFYAELDAGKYVTGYLDQDFVNTVSREAFVLLHDLPTGMYVKAGKMNLPFGLRLDDDTSFIRTNLNMTYANQDVGAEFGIAPGPFEGAIAISNGNPGTNGDENLAKAVTTDWEWTAKNGRLGTSFQWNRRSKIRLLQGGVHGGFKVGPVIWLGEIDLQQSHVLATRANTSLLAGYGEIDWQVLQGLYLKSVYDYLDPDTNIAHNSQYRVGLGFDLYPLPHTQFSLLYRINVGAGGAGDDQFLAKIHFFF